MRFYEVLVADAKYKANKPLTYGSEAELVAGTTVTVPLQQRSVTGFVRRKVSAPDFVAKEIKTVLSSTPLPAYHLELAKWMSDYYACSSGEALRLLAPSRPTIRRSSPPVHFETFQTIMPENFTLTTDQDEALGGLAEQGHVTTLLHGDTGTGKTELYSRLAQEVLGHEQSVLVLVPEIALTAQLISYLEKRLPAPVVSLHSHLSVAQRKQRWLQVLEATEPQVVIGPRSALFAPIHKLGLIIVDEAHEPAYKQEQSPYYHGVRVASKLGALSGAKVVLGSATPDVVDYYLAEQKSAVIRMRQLAQQTGESEDTPVTVVDLRQRDLFSRDHFLSDPLLDQARKCLDAKKQVLFYLNRRGTARVIMCTNCGWQLHCPNCDVPLVYHGDTHNARCHICGYQTHPPNQCPVCSSPDIVYRGAGTKAIAESLERLFPHHRVVRFDSDNKADESAEQQYRQLVRGEAEIIVGTQVMAKGFDLPKLGLVGVVIADTPLFLPDYRANERTYQLLTQVMGRVGRGHTSGRVVIQTYQPDNPAVMAAVSRDWPHFYDNELAQRQIYHYPPFTHLLKLICRRATQNGARQASERLADSLRQNTAGITVNGPSPAFFEKQHGKYTWHIIVRSASRSRLTAIANNLPTGWIADPDPIHLL